jgi:hypothetical protein
MKTSSLEKALKETWEKKDKFYEDTKGLRMIEIIEKIEGKKFEMNSGENILRDCESALR